MVCSSVDSSAVAQSPLFLSRGSHRHRLPLLTFSSIRSVFTVHCHIRLTSAGRKLVPHPYKESRSSLVFGFPQGMLACNSLASSVDGTPSNCLEEHEESDQGSVSVGANVMVSKEDLKGDESSSSVEEMEMIRICDRLVQVFMVDMPNTADWRRILIFSKEWCIIRPHFYKRITERAEKEEFFFLKEKLLRLGRKLKEVDEDIQRHDELLQLIRATPSEINEIIVKRRKDFTVEFFQHLRTVTESYFEDPAEQDALVLLGKTCLSALQAYDKNVIEDLESIKAAQLKLHDILTSPSVDAAVKKINNLVQTNQFDSTLMLILTKAWSDAKETDMMKDEAKDILFHLYQVAVANLQRLVPKEMRIIKYLLTIKDPGERISALKDAFTPGDELEGDDVDFLYSTPEKLFNLIQTIVDAYNHSRQGTLVGQARDLMNPTIIKGLVELQELIKNRFM